jgi:hypothetical protein
MAYDKIDLFWEIFKSVSGGTGNVTDALDAIAKSDRTKLEDYFSNVVDQSSFLTTDYNRLRRLIIDLFASHRSLATSSLRASDVRSISNSDLDELFRSFGYPHSTSLRDFDENPLEQKIQFFLDLVNLYKVKGTPQSLVDVLQYYGVTEVDIYEFFLKKLNQNTLYFDGKVVAGTTTNPIDIAFPYANLTQGDPHWLYTAEQIIQLHNTTKINLPSKTPYIGVQPIVEVDNFEMSTIVRRCQDEFDYYQSTGSVPTASAEISYIGELRSFLELYLSAVYMFNKQFSVGREDLPLWGADYLCYDGTSIDPEIIKAEFDSIINVVPTSRLDQKQRYQQYLDEFTRPTPTNFLVNSNSAEYWLGVIAPDIKSQLDSAGEPLDVLYSLLKDMALWVRANIGFGFVNFGFILFGVQEFFKTLAPAINFFKPYRARILLLEQLQVRSRVPNTIIVEDAFDFYAEQTVHDFITGNSSPCCPEPSLDSTAVTLCNNELVAQCKRTFTGAVPATMNWRGIWQAGIAYAVNDVVPDLNGNQYICTQLHVSNDQTKPPSGASYGSFWSLISTITCSDSTSVARYYSRDTFDCGSAFDYGAVVSGEDNVEITYEETIYDSLHCPPSDGTGFVVSEISNLVRLGPYSHKIREGVSGTTVIFDTPQPDLNYTVIASLRNNNPDEVQYVYDYIITSKQTSSFTVDFTGSISSPNYYLDWFLVDTTSTTTGIVPLNIGDTSKTIIVPNLCGPNYNVLVSLVNTVDTSPAIYSHSVTRKSINEFEVDLSGPMDSTNYHLEWIICEGLQYGNEDIAQGLSEVTVYLNSPLTHTHYPVLINLSTDSTSEFIISGIVKKRYEDRFVVLLSASVPTDNYQISWLIPDEDVPPVYSFDYYQTGGFRDFDEEGRFDCTYNFDYFTIRVEEISGYLLQENGKYLLQENGKRIIL